MILVLSAFNGIEELVDKVYSSFDSDVSIIPIKGKTIYADSIFLEELSSLKEVKKIDKVIKGNTNLSLRKGSSMETKVAWLV
ncbi:MAG: hypothetical protein AAF487_10190 [Bacteroidota bacterium]